ncbi:peptidase M4 family protein, partial [Streptomyces sp. NPDC096012]
MTSRYARHSHIALAVASAVAGALLTTALNSTAVAQPATGRIQLAAAPASLSAAARTTLIQQARAGAVETARHIGLGA